MVFGLLYSVPSDRVEEFIPDDEVISDLGECLTKLDSVLFQIYKYIIILKSRTKLKMDVLLDVCLVNNLQQHYNFGLENK